jgi:hypothetical protein
LGFDPVFFGAGLVLGASVVKGGAETGGIGIDGADAVGFGVADGAGLDGDAGGRLAVTEGCAGVAEAGRDMTPVFGAVGAPPTGEDPVPSGVLSLGEDAGRLVGVPWRTSRLWSPTWDAP